MDTIKALEMARVAKKKVSENKSNSIIARIPELREGYLKVIGR
jgi:hypothetical protein